MKRLTIEQIDQITNEFYSCFCGINLLELKSDIHFVCNKFRDDIVKGFNCKYTVYVLIKEDLCVISYSQKYSDFFDKLKGEKLDYILNAIEKKFKIKKMQLLIFKNELVNSFGVARILNKDDFKSYKRFFSLIHPKINSDDWLQEYFEEKVNKEYFTGYFVGDSLVSVCDAPDMPYMENKIQHTGIVTLPEERKKGYAKLTTALATHNLIENGICPQWECQLDNTASISLAESIGYKKYGVALIVEE